MANRSTKNRPFLRNAIAAIAVLTGGAGAYGQVETTWIVDHSGSWHDGQNWSTGQPPQMLQTVIIDRPAADVSVTYSTGNWIIGPLTCRDTLVFEGGSLSFVLSSSIARLSLSGGTLTGFGGQVRLDIIESFDWTGGMVNFLGEVHVAGATQISGNGSKELLGVLRHWGPVTWSGSGMINLGSNSMLVVGSTGSLVIENDALIEDVNENAFLRNEGELRKISSGTTTVKARLVNFGTLRLESGVLLCLGTFAQYDGVTRLEGGTIISPEGTDFLAGTVTGEGVFTGNPINAASVSPGDGVGTLTIAGNFTQTETGSVRVELGGTSPSEYDLLEITGQAVLDGELRATLVNGFVPEPGDRFEVINCASRIGEFADVVATNAPGHVQFVPVYTGNGVALLTVRGGAVWVDFAHAAPGSGTFEDPFDTLAAGAAAVDSGGTVMLKAGSTDETVNIGKAMTLFAFGGRVVIGQ